jgi:hypothetical protein
MSKLNEMALSGPITSSDIDEISKLLDSEKTEINHYSAKSQAVNEIIDVIFNDFSTTVFVRDLVLSKAIEEGYKALRLVFQYFKGKERKIENIGLEKDFLTIEGKAFRIRFLAKSEQFDMLVTIASSIPKDDLIPQGDDTFVDVLIDEKGHVTINVM